MRRGTVALCAALAALPAAVPAQTVQPGQWEIVTTITDAAIPGAPPAAIAAMKARASRVSSCLTAAEANRGPQDILRNNRQCRFTRYVKKAGRLDSQMVCSQPGGTTSVTSSGRYDATSFTTVARMTRSGTQSLTMTTRAEGKRVGACAR